MLSPFFQPHSTVLNEKSINLLLFFLRCAVFNHYSATTTKFGICEFQLHCIEFELPRNNFNIKQPRGKNHERYRTGPDQLYPIRLRYDQTGRCLSSPPSRGLYARKCLPSGCVHQRLDPLMPFSSLRSDHLERTIIQKNRAQTKYRQNTKHKQGASQLSPEKESRVIAAFQGGAFSLFPPGSNCLFSSLVVLCL